MTEAEYDHQAIVFLEILWGDGFLSPGGKQEVDRIVKQVDFTNKTVLDLGCGSGGVTCYLAENHPATLFTGFDVEDPVIAAAKKQAENRGLVDRVHFIKGEPGPLPFSEGSFDILFSKDAMVHIADKETLFADIFRILKPGGVLAASDWLTSHDGKPSSKMMAYLTAEGLSFGMASPQRYRQALQQAGFSDIETVNRNDWYFSKAKDELAQLTGSLKQKLITAVGADYLNKNIRTWKSMLEVLETGEHCPTHIFACKPVNAGGTV